MNSNLIVSSTPAGSNGSRVAAGSAAPSGHSNGPIPHRTIHVAERVRVDGKFLRVGKSKFWVRGVTYGPFKPSSEGLELPERPQIEGDFAQLRELGANTIRVYHAPPRWLLDMAGERGLKVFVDIPWSKHRCFLDSDEDQQSGRDAVRRAARTCAGHPALLAYSVVNEIPPDVLRWHGANRIEKFIEELTDIAKAEDPDGLVTFASYPPTEYLHPETVDFYTMNVYLHSREQFRAYLQRLQNQADEKPLLLGEYGIDSIREGLDHQAELVAMQLDEVYRCGLVGSCVFSYTDDWFTGGHQISDWAFGMVTADRQPKPAFAEVAKRFHEERPLPPLERTPRVSVVVCSYNGANTLESCLQSLERLNYPDYEVILVDDGSTDDTRQIASRHPTIRFHHQRNKGLSAARNVGMDLATGAIIAYTDSDCDADEDWLYFLVGKLLQADGSAVGGPNLLPRDDGPVAACVSASPGTPAHILIDDEVAEHIPGCNMAFWADRLRAIGGFDPVYTKAGDDVDVCWRLQAQGERLLFAPAAMVWHHRRSTVRAYLKQQAGYGEAEALLKRKHPDKFRGFRADSSWIGRIYTRAGLGLEVGKPAINFGQFATGLFQTIYSPTRIWWPLAVTSLEWWLVICLLVGLAQVYHPILSFFKKTPTDAFAITLMQQIYNPFVALPALMLALTFGVAYLVAGQAHPPKQKRRWWSRLLIAAMHIAQPVERGFARYRARFRTIRIPSKLRALRRAWERRAGPLLSRDLIELWSDNWIGREKLLERLAALAKRNRWNARVDAGWEPHDISFYGDRWCKIELTSVTVNHGGGKLMTRLRLKLRSTLFYNALLLMLWYALMWGWFAGHDWSGTEFTWHEWSGEEFDWHRHWELSLIPVFVLVGGYLRALRRRLNRTVVASILSVAEELGMSVVGAPGLLRRRQSQPTPRESLASIEAEDPDVPAPPPELAAAASPPSVAVASVAPVAPSAPPPIVPVQL